MPNRIWDNFERVHEFLPTDRRVYRSAAPNYVQFKDSSQHLLPAAIEFLKEEQISGLICVNEYSYSGREIELLQAADIRYLHLSVRDPEAPSLGQLREAYHFVVTNRAHNSGTLVHCGFGYGRTGTVVTGIQLQETYGESPDESVWQTENHVETTAQEDILVKLRDSLKNKE